MEKVTTVPALKAVSTIKPPLPPKPTLPQVMVTLRKTPPDTLGGQKETTPNQQLECRVVKQILPIKPEQPQSSVDGPQTGWLQLNRDFIYLKTSSEGTLEQSSSITPPCSPTTILRKLLANDAKKYTEN